MAKITVHGVASREVKPERAVARLGVEASGENRAEVLATAQRAHAELVAEAKTLVTLGPALNWSALDIQVGTYIDWVPSSRLPGQQEQVRKYRALGDITIEFDDFEALGRLLAKVAEYAGVEVRGVAWKLTDATTDRIERDIRVEAVRDAVRRAQDYTAGMGSLHLEAIYEDGLYGGGGSGSMPIPSPRTAMLANAKSLGPGFELKPAVVPVTAEVVAVFATAGQHAF